ncbi:MAG TPA: hypothetical protein VJR47_05735 [Stellaceae bacterium]|nr:hypothetical protein [Stellaceae bacterium]
MRASRLQTVRSGPNQRRPDQSALTSKSSSAAIALSLLAPLGMVAPAFADNSNAQVAPQQQAAAPHQPSNSGPYDGPDFVIPLSQTY